MDFHLQRARPSVACQRQTVRSMRCSVVLCLPSKEGREWWGVVWYPYMQVQEALGLRVQ